MAKGSPSLVWRSAHRRGVRGLRDGGTALLTMVARSVGMLRTYSLHPGAIEQIRVGILYFFALLVESRIVLLGVVVPQILWWVATAVALYIFAIFLAAIGGRIAGRVVLGFVSLLVSGWLITMLAPAILGDLRAAYFMMFWAGLLGGVYGFFLVPRVRHEWSRPSPLRLGHWVLAAAWMLLFAFTWGRGEYRHQKLSAIKNPQLQFIFEKWAPADAAIREEPIGPYASPDHYLTDAEVGQLRDAGFTGILHCFGGDPKTVRFVIVMSRPVQETVDLPKPASGSILYIQTQTGWKKFPPSAATVARTVRLTPAPPDKHNSLPSTRLSVDAGLGHPKEIPVFATYSWMPDEMQAPLPTVPATGSGTLR